MLGRSTPAPLAAVAILVLACQTTGRVRGPMRSEAEGTSTAAPVLTPARSLEPEPPWPSDVPALEGARVDATSERHTRLLVDARGRQPRDILDQWLTVATDGGARVVAHHPESDSADLILPSGARAFVLVSGDAGKGVSAVLGRASNTTPPAVPGRCVAVPKVVLRIRMRSNAMTWKGDHVKSEWIHELGTTFDEDVDADGSLDAWVPVAPSRGSRDCAEDARWKVYAMRGACGHLLGTVGPGTRPIENRESAPLASGFRPLDFTFQKELLGGRRLDQQSFEVHTLRFEVVRGLYQRVSETVAAVTVGECQHCAHESCTLER